MPTLTESKCRNCAAPLNPAEAQDGVIRCDYCGSVFTLPKKDTEPEALDAIRIGNHELDICRFDDAFASFNKAAQIDPNEPEAYMGMALATHKVQYIRDSVNNRLQPICHEVSNKVFAQDKNYLRALALATPEQKAQYERGCMDIDYIRGEFEKLKASGADYDCFICVKVTDDETKGRTPDYKLADDIYFHLRGKGYNPFFSEREIQNRVGADYEALILYALYSSECMLVVCGNESYLQTAWVKNEYTRFLKMVNDDEKESDSVAIVFSGSPIERLPGRKGKLQGIDMRGVDPYGKITSFVENHTPEAKQKREQEKQRKAAEEDARKKKLDEQAQKLANLEGRLASVQASGSATQFDSLLKRAKQFAEVSDFVNATEYYNKVLDASPENFDAWRGLFLSELEAHDENELLKSYDGRKAATAKHSKNLYNCKKCAPDEFLPVLNEVQSWANEWNGFIVEQRGDELVLTKYEGDEQDVVVPYGVTVLGSGRDNEKGVFSSGDITKRERYENIRSITLPETVKTIAEYAFGGCKAAKINLPNSVTCIKGRAFASCTNLTSITIPDNITSIEENMFHNCKSLTSITIPNGVTSIEKGAFSLCSNLTSIIIPDSVISIKGGLYEISRDGAFEECSKLVSVKIGNGVRSIAARTFRACSSLTNVTIPNSVTSIGDSAFAGCKNIKTVTMPKRFKKQREKIFEKGTLRGCIFQRYDYNGTEFIYTE